MTRPRTTAESRDIIEPSAKILGLLGELKNSKFTLSLEPNKDNRSPTIHDLTPEIPVFHGKSDHDNIDIDEWQIRMRLKLRQMNCIEHVKDDEKFKANYVLSKLTDRALKVVRHQFVGVYDHRENSVYGFDNAEEMLEWICDLIRKKGKLTSLLELAKGD